MGIGVEADAPAYRFPVSTNIRKLSYFSGTDPGALQPSRECYVAGNILADKERKVLSMISVLNGLYAGE
jgi:hypothetical protein